ncbi:Mediator of RNA polymerase II transcription subunit 25 [Ananas comosus]|uniref:Mediator of RNA polymerase II transcription subunit 25 n=1 Tax=Ananas comosus TaxID=4615 RepID=A0A199VZX3_ANACO|nr:Mediator of RNA polymerase II transcription subunit 25 [Ananas comosus]
MPQNATRTTHSPLPLYIYMYVHTSLSLSLSLTLYIYSSEEERGVEREEGGEEEEERRRRRAMAERQLIVVVEGTAALGPYWSTILSDYLEKIIRSFSANELNGQKISGAGPEFAMVIFNTHGALSAFTVQRSGWTKDPDVFLRWLSGIPFIGGGFNDTATAEGLADALVMFPLPPNPSQQNHEMQKHCILVAASNPYPLPTPVYRPPPPHSENAEAPTESWLADAETTAKSFGQWSISLSVIAPKQLPKLKAIYNAGKRNPRAAEPAVDHAKNPHFLVLLSENFMEARVALTRPPNVSNVKVDGASAAPAASVAPTSSNISVNGSIMSRQALAGGNMPTATVKVEPTTIPSLVPGPTFSHLPAISNVTSQGIPTLQSSSPSPISQEMNAINDNVQEHKPLVNPVSQQLRPVGPAAANVNILNNLSQHRQMMNSTSLAGASSIGLPMHMSSMISSGMTSAAMSGISSLPGVTQNTNLGSFTSATSNMSSNSNIGIAPSLANLQGNISMGQSLSNVAQASLASGGQIGQSGIGMNQNIMSGLGTTGISSGTGPGTMIPTPGMSQQAGVHSLGMTGNSSINMPMTQHPNVQQSQSKYVKIWEGTLSGQRQNQPVFICKLEGYRSASAADTLASDWPSTMQIVRLIAQEHMNNKQYVGKADFLVFRTLNQHGFLGQLQEKKLCAVIQLPTQTLLLSVSDKAGRLIGMLFPGVCC